MEVFAVNMMEYLCKEWELLLDGVGVFDICIEFDGWYVFVVVCGYYYCEDL